MLIFLLAKLYDPKLSLFLFSPLFMAGVLK
jgi:hypothetical protein